MDPITFGLMTVGVSGGAMLTLTTLDKLGIKINDAAVSIILEMSKAGILLYVLKHIWKLFM